ncbi:hypothetical protein ACWEO2_30935 [Nocardia sp. NPDC004278]
MISAIVTTVWLLVSIFMASETRVASLSETAASQIPRSRRAGPCHGSRRLNRANPRPASIRCQP